MKLAGILMLMISVALSSLAQTSDRGAVSERYTNEMASFKLANKYGLDNLMSKPSFAKDVEQLFGPCKPAELFGCELDESWTIAFTYVDTSAGPLNSVIFYPKKRISFSKIKRPRAFVAEDMMIVHLPIAVEEFITWTDKCGLSYVLVNQGTDPLYKKGDLFYIEYGSAPHDKPFQCSSKRSAQPRKP